ncbi:MAG: hypothetical protein A2Y07_04550 [Planctomycetes bacterium GWF2_50_10]|nr:MAG: hypothetical protein A2Y07_04550 [Planctomycetes bacterium GWF2_50_10]
MKLYAIAFLAVLAVATCYGADANAPVTESKDTSAVNDSIAVTVDGQNIMESDITKKIEPRLKATKGQVPPQYEAEYKAQLRKRAVEGLVVEAVLDKKIKEQNIAISDDEIKAEMEKQLKQQNMTEEDLKKILTMYGLSFDDYKAQLKKGLAYQKMLDSKMAGQADVNDAQAKEYYEKNPAEFKTPEQVRASHILISTRSTDPNADANSVKAAAKKKADELMAQIKNGADFAELAKANSSCPSKDRGGDLGFFGKGQMVPEFDAVAFSMKVGDVNGPVETQFGYHIIKVTEHKDPNTTTLEQALPQIKEKLAAEKKGKLAQVYVEQLKSEAKIVYPAGKEPNAPPKAIIGAKPEDANKN